MAAKWGVPAALVAALILLGASPFIVNAAPAEISMGLVSKIFYFHVPFAETMLLSAILCGVASLVYLTGRRPAADHVALAAAELTVVFGVVALVTGPLWARKAWGVWWAWEGRLAMTLVMWMIFASYLLLRRFGGAGSEALAAVVGIFGMAVAPFVYWSVNLWRTMHPLTSVLPSLPASMARPLIGCALGVMALYVALLAVRVRLERNRALADELFLRLEDLE